MGPFTVLATVGKVAYKLDLPNTMSVHPVFHVSLLKPYVKDGKVQPPTPVIEDGELYFEVETILDHRFVSIRSGGRGKKARKLCEYLIRWNGYEADQDSWEPDEEISQCGELYLAYWAKLGLDPPTAIDPTITD